ncbi:MAG: hypothetical protein M3Z75_17900 [Actinomycetota bacterium]|nr:hypothetical protein [Actinomycetota bacterium]
MPSEPANIEPPPHPVHALTTYELRDYRRQLEHALKTLPEHAKVRALLGQKLDQVRAEQTSRAQLQQAAGQ